MSLAQAAKAPGLEDKASFNALPIIDLTNMCSPNPAERRAIAQEIRNACFTAGFFYVKNHGVSSEIIDPAYNAMKEFFALPVEKKMKLDSRARSTLRGYQPLFSATNDQTNGVTDAHEGFEFGAEDPDPLKNNIWPSEEDLPRFRKDVVSYYDAVVKLGKGLFPLFALAMDLPEDYFKDKTKGSGALIHLLHYPERLQGEVGNPLQMGIGAHTDWECFTILWQQPNTLALEVMNASKQWVSAPPLEGTFVVNIGDQFARWTNDLFNSNIHRATSPFGTERYSIPLFFGTDHDVLIEPFPSCVEEDHPAKYESITAGEYVRQRASDTYGKTLVAT